MTTATAVQRPAQSTKSIAWYVTLLLIPVLTGGFLFWLRNAQMERNSRRVIASYGTVPAFQLTNQDGQPFGTEQLNGKIWIVDFIFSTCPGPCPMISSRMADLQKPLEKTDVRLVSVTVDPEKDTPEVLRGYADKLEAQPGRWDFLTGPKATIYDLSRSGFKLPVSEDG
jgi:cytochrome oxidase Cu insertion factor (SCO1/SenC/PrrC family)